MQKIHSIASITELHEFIGLGKPLHPLITVIRNWPAIDFDFTDVKMKGAFYIIGLKENAGSMGYGRNSYDFDEGTIVNISPGQVLTFENSTDYDEGGWSLFFHPDLIRKTGLGTSIDNYAFFNYDIQESLHISEKEKHILEELVRHIEIELEQNIDKHSQDIIITNIEAILIYCQRFYDRQFFTRSGILKDAIVQFDHFLKRRFESDSIRAKGIPTVSECGEALNMSSQYLSDMLRIETGRSAKDHIHDFVIEKAKAILLNSNLNISEIAYELGFEYPQHFTKLFKTKTGFTPSEYRNVN